MKTKVQFKQKSKNSGKVFTISYDFRRSGVWFVHELGKELEVRDMWANFRNIHSIQNKLFREQNVGVEFEVKKETFTSDNFTNTTTKMFVEGKEVGETIQNAVFDFLPEGRYKIAAERMFNKNFSEKAMREITKENQPENIW